MTRSLREGARWGTSPEAATDYGRKADETPEPARADFTFFAEVDDDQAVLARVMLLSTIDRERGAHALRRPRDPARGRSVHGPAPASGLTGTLGPMDHDERARAPAARCAAELDDRPAATAERGARELLGKLDTLQAELERLQGGLEATADRLRGAAATGPADEHGPAPSWSRSASARRSSTTSTGSARCCSGTRTR